MSNDVGLVADWTALTVKCVELEKFLSHPGTIEQHETDDDLALLQAQLDAMRVLLFMYELRISKMQ